MLHNHVTWSLPGLKRLALALVLVGVVGLLGLQTPVPAAQAQTLSVDSLLRADGTVDLTRGASGTGGVFDLRGWKVALDPKRGPVLSRVEAAPMAVDTWAALPGHGLNGQVSALAVFGGNLYVGGSFSQTNDGSVSNLNEIAKFDGTNWSALPHNGLNAQVDSLAVFGGNLYVGGSFSQTNDGSVSNLNHIAKFDGTNWSALPHNGLNGQVNALAVMEDPSTSSGQVLYVGGGFTDSADSSVILDVIARYDGTSWSALPNDGLNSTVFALVVGDDPLASSGQSLYVGGVFTHTVSSGVSLNHIAKFDGTSWSALPGNGLNTTVYALAVSGQVLYVGGGFGQTADGTTNTHLGRIAKFDGTSWSALSGNGLNSDVNALTVSGTNLYVGGNFVQTADGTTNTHLNHIAKYDLSANGGVGGWVALPDNGLNTYVDAMAVSGQVLYAGGPFTQTAGGATTNLNRIAKLTLAPTQDGPTFVVNSDADTDDGLCDVLGHGNGNADCTLREAINAANAQGGANTIHFDIGRSITLAATLPTLTGDTTIDGETNSVDVSGAGAYRIFTVESAITLNVNQLALHNGKAEPALTFGHSGGAIYDVGGTLNVSNSAFASNSAGNYGGAIYTNGPTSISNSTFYQNNATELGGGVTVNNGTILNSTFSENVSASGGAVWAGGTLTLKNTILTYSTGGDCSASAVTNAINNLIDDANSACGLVNGTDRNIIGVPSFLEEFDYHGGPTPNFGLYAISPAVDNGDDATCTAAPVSGVDQRGIGRSFGTHCDIGAFEKTTADCGSELPEYLFPLKPGYLQTLNKTKVAFDWTDSVCATSYKITVKNKTTHTKVTKTVTSSHVKLILPHGKEVWFVQACNDTQCVTSAKFKFTN